MLNRKNKTKMILAILLSLIFISTQIFSYDHYKGDYTKQKDIVTTAVDAGSFKTLAAALQAANLIETLKGEGPYTVFASGGGTVHE